MPTLLLREGPFDYTEVLVDPYILFVAADSPLAGNGPVGLEDVAELPLIGHVTCRVLPRVEAALGARAAGAASGLRA